jgi:predicted RNA-binding protein (virulence factor B family)
MLEKMVLDVIVINRGVYVILDESLLVKSPQKYAYFLNEETYETEVALHAADSNTCLGGEHDWKKSFIYRRYTCKNCEAQRMRID